MYVSQKVLWAAILAGHVFRHELNKRARTRKRISKNGVREQNKSDTELEMGKECSLLMLDRCRGKHARRNAHRHQFLKEQLARVRQVYGRHGRGVGAAAEHAIEKKHGINE